MGPGDEWVRSRQSSRRRLVSSGAGPISCLLIGQKKIHNQIGCGFFDALIK
jgi:hypothetical protein